MKDKKKCIGKAKKCEWNELFSVHEGGSTGSIGMDGKKKICLPKCSRNEMTISQSDQPYPAKQTFKKRKEICYLFKKLIRVCSKPHRASVFEETYGKLLPCQDLFLANNGDFCQNDKFDYKKHPYIAEALFQYAKENLAHLKVYIKDPFYTLSSKEVQIGLGSFLGNLGGLLGIFLGLTAYGIFELLSFLIHLIAALAKSFYL